MVSEVTWLNEDSFLISNLFFITLILWWKAHFLIMELIVSFPDDIEVSSSQLKRFNKSVIDPKCFWSEILLFDNILSFSSNIIFSCILLFLFENHGLHAFQNGLELQSTLSSSKYCNLASDYSDYLLTQILISLLKLDLFALFLRHVLIIVSFRRFLLKCGFWFPRKFFVFLGGCLSKIEKKNFFVGSMGSHSRHTIKKIQFKLVTIILLEIAVYWFLRFNLFWE